MAVAFPNPATELSTVLRNIGYPATIVRHIHDVERLTTLQEINQIHKDLIEPLFKGMKERAPPVIYTTLQVSLFKTLHSFCRRMALSRTPVNPAEITYGLLQQEMDYIDEPMKRETDKKIPFPAEGFKTDTLWLTFRQRFKNYLDSSASSKRSVPLSYVIRPDVVPANADATDPIWTVLLEGTAYRDDNRLVYTYLVSLTQDGPGKTYVAGFKDTRDGRAAFRLLDSTFTGGSYKTLLHNDGWTTLEVKKFYGHTNYTWSKYKSDVDEAFQKLEEAKTVLDEATKVYHLLKGIKAPFLFESINQVRQTIPGDYHAASIYLANAVLTASANDVHQRGKPQRHISRVHTGRYSDEDWEALSSNEKQEVQRLRKENRSGRGRTQGRTHAGRNGHSNQGRTQGRVQGRGRGGRGQGRGRGRNENGGRGQPAGRDITRQVQQVQGYELNEVEEEEPVEDDWVYDVDNYDEAEENVPLEPRRGTTTTRGINKYRRIATILVRRIGSVSFNEPGRCELDTHADNCMLGKDALVLEVYEGQKFQVYGYKKDAPTERYLCRACLAYDDVKSGITYILIFDQCFVDENLTSSLICPNQLRDNEVIVEDVPVRYDSRSSHSIKVGNVVIPLSCKGYISYFNVRKPSDVEVDTLEQLEMTGSKWDPHSDDHDFLENAATTSAVSSTSTYAVNPSILAKRLLITPEAAEQTLRSTTILASKIYNEPKFSSYGHRFRYLTRKHLKGRFYTDTFFASIKSLDGFNAAQLFINELRYVHIVLMKSKAEAPIALRNFFDNVGLPDLIISDNSKEQGGQRYGSQAWKQTMNEFGVLQRYTEPYKHWQNYAENGIKLVKFRSAKVMERRGVPRILWDQTLEYCGNLSNRIYHKTPRLEGRTPYEWVHGISPDISAFINFDFYDYIFYTHHPKPLFPEPKRSIGRWLGPSKSVVCDLVFKVLTKSGHVIHTSAVEPVTPEERDTDAYKKLINDYDKAINEKLGLGLAEENILELFDLEGETSPEALVDESQVCTVRVHGSVSQETMETVRVLADVSSGNTDPGWETARVTIPRGDSTRRGFVRRKKRDQGGC